LSGFLLRKRITLVDENDAEKVKEARAKIPSLDQFLRKSQLDLDAILLAIDLVIRIPKLSEKKNFALRGEAIRNGLLREERHYSTWPTQEKIHFLDNTVNPFIFEVCETYIKDHKEKR
jgi:hypothetical protein